MFAKQKCSLRQYRTLTEQPIKGRNEVEAVFEFSGHFLFYKLMENLTITLQKSDVILIIKAMKIARARKKREVSNHLKKEEMQRYESKQSFIHKSTPKL